MEGQIYAFKHQIVLHNICIYIYPIFYRYITYTWSLKAQPNCYAFPNAGGPPELCDAMLLPVPKDFAYGCAKK